MTMITWTSRTSAADASWHSVTYGNGLFVAVSSGVGGKVMTSPDGINWTLRTSNDAANGWKGVTYGNGLFVAVTSGGNVATSPDGVNWTLRTPPYIYWYGVTYGNGLFVAVTDWATGNGGNNVMISPDGTNWTPETAIDNVWQSVTYGNGLFVAVSRSITGNRVMTGSMYPSCISTPKYSGDPVILRATPRDGIGPYLVEFYKDEVPVPIGRLTSPLVITTNPTTKSIVENTLVGGTYILDDIDVANAVGGRINFSVYIEDSCPTGPMNCGSTCTINIGCVAPVCNFVVT